MMTMQSNHQWAARQILSWLLAILFAAILSACGGGGGGPPSPTTNPPPINPPPPPPPPGPPKSGDTFGVSPTDLVSMTAPAYQNQIKSSWGINAVQANWAHWATCLNPPCDSNNKYLRGKGVTVALVDEGVQFNHPDLVSALITTGKNAPMRSITLSLVSKSNSSLTINLILHKQYAAKNYTITLTGAPALTIFADFDKPTQTLIAQTMIISGEERTMTATITIGGPVILTAGENIIANDFSKHQPLFSGFRGITIDTINGFDFVGCGRDKTPPMPPCLLPIFPYTPAAYTLIGDSRQLVESHGTHVGGIIVGGINSARVFAVEKNGTPATLTIGMAGVAPEAKILPIKLLGGEGTPQDYRLELEEAFDYAIANSAFVANNSYGQGPALFKISVTTSIVVQIYENATVYGHKITVTALGPDDDYPSITVTSGFIWIEMPALYEGTSTMNADGTETLLNISIAAKSRELNIYQEAITSNSGMLLVFAQGNDGWNSETGVIRTCVNDPTNSFHCIGGGGIRATLGITLSLHDLNRPTVYGIFGVTFALKGSAVLASVTENQMEAVQAIPATNALLASNWLNVVAVDANTVIAHFSNGCGSTEDFCLAAPGVSVWSAVPYRFPGDFIPSPSAEITSTLHNFYNRFNGTSGAAPFVTGAAALIKGAFPNLNPATVAAILKDSADGLGTTCSHEDGSTQSKLTMCVDDVYGHGMLNVSAAFDPGITMKVGNTELSFPLRDIRINLSPAFGQAAWRHQSFRIGAIDRYGRAYPAIVDFDSGIILAKPAPGGAVIDRVYASPLSQSRAAPYFPSAADALFAINHQETNANKRIIFSVRQQGNTAHREAQMDFAGGKLAWRHSNGAPASTSEHSADDFWTMPVAGTSHNRHRLSYAITTPFSHHTKMHFAHESGDNFQQTGLRVAYAADAWQLYGEGGIIGEDDKILGATFGGGLNVDKSATAYQRIGAHWRPFGASNNDAALYASYARTDSKAKTSGLLRSLSAASDEFAAGLRWQNWQVRYLRPLAVVGGRMNLSVIDGYANNDYHISDISFDLSAQKRREQIIGLMYQNDSTWHDGMRYGLAVNHTQNAAAKNHIGNALGFSAALHFEF